MSREQPFAGRVSVVIPAFNRVRFIESSVQSALQQTISPLEVIVVDDESKDGTPELVEKLKSVDSRVRCIRQPFNQGPAAARNAGVVAANGEFIAFLDSDDTWEPAFLQGACAFIDDHPNIQLVFGEMRIVSVDGKIRSPSVIWGDYNLGEFVSESSDGQDRYLFTVPEREAVLRRYFLPIQATLIRRETMLAHPFDESCQVGEDLDFLIQLGLSGVRFGFMRRVSCNQVIHDGNLLSNSNNRLRDDRIWTQVWEKSLRHPSLTRHESRLIRRQIARHYFSIGYAYSSQGSTRKALAAYAHSFRAVPSVRAVFAASKALAKRCVGIFTFRDAYTTGDKQAGKPCGR